MSATTSVGIDIFPGDDDLSGNWIFDYARREDDVYVVRFGERGSGALASLYLSPQQIVALRDHLNAALASEVTANVDAVAVVALHGDEVAE